MKFKGKSGGTKEGGKECIKPQLSLSFIVKYQSSIETEEYRMQILYFYVLHLLNQFQSYEALCP